MAKAKKLLLTLLSLVFFVVMALSVVACDLSGLTGGGNDNGGNNDITGDDNNDDDNDDNGGKDEVVYQVTEAQFNAALDISGAPFKAVITSGYVEVGVEEGGMNSTVEYAVDKIKLDQNVEGQGQMLVYFEKDGSNYFMYAEQNGAWFKMPTTEGQFNNCLTYTPAGMLEQQGGANYSDFTYNESTKAYVYSMNENGSSGSFKLYFENQKVVKMEIAMSMAGEGSATLTVNYSYSNVTVTLPEVGNLGGNGGNEDVGGGDDNQEEHVCDMQATAWFDANHNYPKTLECSCGETEDRKYIVIKTAEELVTLANDLANGVNIGKEKIEIANDIDLTGLEWTPMVINNMQKETTIYGANDGITITGLTDSFIDVVKTGLKLQNITIDGAQISNDNGCAGAFINNVAIGVGATAMKKDVTIEGCKLVNSSVTAIYAGSDNNCFAGGIYGKVEDGSALVTLRVDRCTVENSTITSSVYAGAVAGAMSNVASGKNPTVAIAESIVQNNTIISAKERGAGIVIGLSGFGACNIDQDTSDVALTSNNAATGNEIENLALYGVTGWASANDKGTLTMMAAMTLQYGDLAAVHQLP